MVIAPRPNPGAPAVATGGAGPPGATIAAGATVAIGAAPAGGPGRSRQPPPAAPRRRRIVVAIVVGSIIIHAVGGIGAAFWVIARYFKPPPATFELKRDLRLAAEERQHRLDLARFDALGAAPVLAEKIASTRPTKIPLPELPAVPFDKMIPLDPAEIVNDQVAGLIGAAGVAGGLGLGGGAGGFGAGSAMSFFGIRDTAKSVAIMIDVSDSMFTRTGDAHGQSLVRRGKAQRFQAIRDEAIGLVENLGINAKFGIVRWSGGAYAWRPQLVPATDANKAAAVRHIQQEVDWHTARPKDDRPGGTRHDYALDEVFRLQPAVIYMLTDGNATAAQPGGGLQPIPASDVWAAAERGQRGLPTEARLHVIYYVTGKDQEDERQMLRALAGRNQGQFKKIAAR